MPLHVERMPLESNFHARIRDGQNVCNYLFKLFVAECSKNNLNFKRYALLRRSVFLFPKRKI